MTGYARKFDENVTMSFRVTNKQLLKNYNKIWEKIEKLIKVDAGSMITNFHNKKKTKKSTMQVFINNDARFCY